MTVESKVAQKRSSTAAHLLAGLFIATIAVLFVMSFAGVVYAQVGMQGDRGSLKGEVVAIDHVHNAQTITLRSGQGGQFPNDTLNIFLNKDTKLNVCAVREPLKDMSVDHNATVTYHELGGVAVAASISEQC